MSSANIRRLEQERYNLVMRNGEVGKKNIKLTGEIVAINTQTDTLRQRNFKLEQEIEQLKREISSAKQRKNK
jgi:cell division protein FtsB